MADGLARALHHEGQRHDMGLTIHYQLAATGDEAHARKLMQQLRQAALDLPFDYVGEIVDFQGDECDWKRRPDDDPYRWLLIQARTDISLPVTPAEQRRGVRRDKGDDQLAGWQDAGQKRCPASVGPQTP